MDLKTHLNEREVLIMFLIGNQMEYLIPNLTFRIGRKFDKDPLGIKQNNYLTKLVNVYIVYDLDSCQEILLTISNLRIAYLEQIMQ